MNRLFSPAPIVGRRERQRLSVVTAVLFLSLACRWAPVSACNIPVFRYAMERWKSDDATIVVFLEASPNAEQQRLIAELENHCRESGGNANAEVQVVTVASEGSDPDPSPLLDVWSDLRKLPDVRLPHVLVRSDLARGATVNLWHGPLKSLSADAFFESPARAKLRERLLAGDSVVWLLVGQPAAERTRAAKTMLEESFRSLTEKVELPEGIGLPGSELYSEMPLVLRFNLIQIDPEDAEERLLVSWFSGVRPEAFESGEPLLVPVFGRGRALEVLPASDVTPSLVEQLTVFLSGACSCQVKEQNPGFDLLLTADWESELFGVEGERPPDRSSEEGTNRNPTLVPIPSGRTRGK